jgi:tRNA(Ile)-lysidine synthase
MAAESSTFRKWSREMRRGGLFRAGERVGVAVSGGPDSILLLDFMKQYAPTAALTLAVVHFNHKLRGDESDADERFVRQRAGELDVEFLRGEADAAQAAREKRRNLEATARELRYRFFFSLVNGGRLDKVATAHNANDQAETVLLRLLRGTGTRGLGGIYPVLEGKIVRPFLNLTRQEIERELRERKLEFRVDSTNLDKRFQRNKIRLELVPWLEKEFNPAVISLLKDLSVRAREDEEELENQAHERALAWRVREGAEEKIPIRALAGFSPAIQRRVLRQMILAARGHLGGFSHGHIEALRQFFFESQSGRNLLMPGQLAARKEFDWLIVGPLSPPPTESGFQYAVEIPGEVSVPELGVALRFKIIEAGELGKTYNERWMAGLDPRKLPEKLVLRNWRAGDRFCPSGSRKARKLKELLGRRKVPLSQRRYWPVLECGGEIVWVRGFPPARQAAASADSKRVIVIEETSQSAR